ARAAGVERFVVPGVDPRNWDRVVGLRETTGVSVALGIHPWVLRSLDSDGLNRALEALPIQAARHAAAIGEVGFDRSLRGEVSLDEQRRVLLAHRAVAEDQSLPLILHVVGEHGAALEALEAGGPLAAGGTVHSFSGNAALVPRYEALNLHLSFAGGVARAQAKKPRAAAAAVSRDRLLIETDAPDQPLAKGARNEPAMLPKIAVAIAECRHCSVEEVASATFENAEALFVRGRVHEERGAFGDSSTR
ncbi:MAG: TatD family hydrolase, partial [Myxococcota bacterium]